MALPPDKTPADALRHAIAWREHLWRRVRDEDDRIEQLNSICSAMHGGDRAAGRRLATDAIWGASIP